MTSSKKKLILITVYMVILVAGIIVTVYNPIIGRALFENAQDKDLSLLLLETLLLSMGSLGMISSIYHYLIGVDMVNVSISALNQTAFGIIGLAQMVMASGITILIMIFSPLILLANIALWLMCAWVMSLFTDNYKADIARFSV